MGTNFGYVGLINITINLICIIIAWWALQGLELKKLSKNPKSLQFISFQVILAIIIGYQLARFFTEYLNWSTSLKDLF